jgi:hypothetical protein
MESTTYVIETAQKTYIGLEQVGNNDLDAYGVALPYAGDQFEEESEANQFIKDLESGKTMNGNHEFRIDIDKKLFPLTTKKLVMNWSVE